MQNTTETTDKTQTDVIPWLWIIIIVVIVVVILIVVVLIICCSKRKGKPSGTTLYSDMTLTTEDSAFSMSNKWSDRKNNAKKITAPKGPQKTTFPKGPQKTTFPKGQQKTTVPKGQQKTTVPKGQQKTTVPKEQQKTTAPKGPQKINIQQKPKTKKWFDIYLNVFKAKDLLILYLTKNVLKAIYFSQSLNPMTIFSYIQ